ncbi:MAG: dihydroxyacetone kinase family protein [Actinomyces sp.]|uniref:dihydroxyacetone kinase family protein n=1 Tax=Actinomyces sp. HMSC075B09 TaxID=1739358 RepID=UPI0008A25254|nr:dihydroxyacetone kinase family protein [Actinomyces sp. HMSC075B09]MBS6101386.1 dihydroxyacetone kinase family protein [Actinomyces sp.]MDU4831843.1 dihydroxyacetone kinase family protein [Actinomyces sp.]OFJ61600.1 dihydroxyacetone kinase [Actinomyces sp. HMSC075B09]
MTRLVNNPEEFPAESIEGFADAFSNWVKPVYGGVVRSTKTPDGKVAIVVGGGSGHYPAFAGWVGPGMADGAVAGNIFSSPSGAQAYSVAKAAERGGGVLIGFGNYAGDVLHFGQAVERLRSEGIDARTLVVTDDVASAGEEDHLKRRGIAGDLPTFKIAGAAAEAGLDIDEVVRVFDKANDRTRSFGVAFSGCTLPGAKEPLFHLEPGRMGVGMGIHGEPGVREDEIGTSDEIAQLLVDGLIKERPEGSDNRVVAIVNGLGDTKYEEMFVLWRDIAKRLRAAGLELVGKEVGEFVTSLDMAGVSLTLVWVDDELLKFWQAPADTPAFRVGNMAPAEVDDRELNVTAEEVRVEQPGSEESQKLAGEVVSVLERIADLLHEKEPELGKIDAVAGDGDHGIGMARGSKAALETARRLASEGGGAATVLAGAGDSWSASAGGTSGALWGALLTAFGRVLGDEAGDANLVDATAAGLEAVTRLGGANVGDKTMIDAFVPAVQALQEQGDWRAATDAARKGAESTKDLVAKVGRARPLGEKSLGTPDAGATSLAMIFEVITEYLEK